MAQLVWLTVADKNSLKNTIAGAKIIVKDSLHS